jgi:hypothetical protein
VCRGQATRRVHAQQSRLQHKAPGSVSAAVGQDAVRQAAAVSGLLAHHSVLMFVEDSFNANNSQARHLSATCTRTTRHRDVCHCQWAQRSTARPYLAEGSIQWY